ncbi:DUF2867 domain-containing protein [Nonomuraea wenchangensis]|uniref:DUF2867 domain-containing protein n=1 Tax=Nonomuraea wenchangensis TaxID=568860 RepID=UPI00331CF27C
MARCLVTGATGYIGGRLVPELLAAGHEVRCMARSPGRLRDLPWRERTEVVKADAADASQVLAALEDIDVAYYLIHTMGGSRHFAHQDRQAAEVFATAAGLAGVRRLRLRAEMRLPGLAWLELSVSRSDAGTVYRQRAFFHPHGLAGHLYWWAVSPFHGLIFGRMPLNVAAAAARREFRRPGRS